MKHFLFHFLEMEGLCPTAHFFPSLILKKKGLPVQFWDSYIIYTHLITVMNYMPAIDLLVFICPQVLIGC